MRRWAPLLLSAFCLLLSILAGCGDDKPATPARRRAEIGSNATIEDVAYIAFERVGLDRLPRDRMEPAGEARVEKLVRRVPAYRLKGSPQAALRYTEDSPQGWLAWQPLAVLYARRELAQREKVPPGQIQTIDVQHETWPDSCLGAPQPGETCAQALVPGFRVILRLGSRLFEYHTDLEERAVSAGP